MSQMSGVVLTAHGGPECLEWRDDLRIPAPGPSDVLIRVGAAGVNNTDINTRVGWYSKSDGGVDDAGWTGDAVSLPRIQGIDVCGRIVAVGIGVNPARIGERVLVEPCIWEAQGQPLASPWFLGSECDGGFAEYTRVAARHAPPVDSSLSDIELASFPCSYSTAENMLMRANVQSDDTVLVTGASGGVGSAAVQLAKAYGARTIAVTGAAKRERLVELGADVTVDRSANIVRELGANSVDVIVDAVAGPTLPSLFELLRPGGRYAVSGAIAGPMIELDVRTLYLKDLSFFGCTVLDIGIFDRLIERIESGQIRPIIAGTYPLREIGEAQIEFQAKTHVGKIVLDVAESRP